jgi:periplasmic divalent cation tolerance protein
VSRFYWVYVTCTNGAEARKIAILVLKKRLAACVNMFPVRSVYWWHGKLEHADEVAMVLKTRSGCLKPLIAEISKAHSYDVPCIEALAIADGNPAYLKWIEDETKI